MGFCRVATQAGGSRPRGTLLRPSRSSCKYTGIHIRHTPDNLVTSHILRRSTPKFDVASQSTSSGFIAAIARASEEGPIFLSTDDHNLESLLTHHYGAQIVSFPKRFVSSRRCCTSAVQDALAEMLLLGRCRRIVGTYFSSFSEFSAIWEATTSWQVRGNASAYATVMWTV